MLVIGLLGSLLLGGCGGSSQDHSSTARVVTFPAYGTFRATTKTVTSGSPVLCRRDAQAFTRDAVSFLVPSASPADLYFVAARTVYLDFEAHRCDVSVLRRALSRRLSLTQRKTLVARIPFLPAAVAQP
jgi:hypothetical protein